jgi:hypothetical protein
MDLQELNALHAELYVTLLSFHSMGIGAIKHKFLRDHLQETMTDMQELMRQADKTIDSMSGTNR